MLKSLLIGDNAFIGVSHLSHTRARERVRQLRLDTINEVFGEAISHSATGFAFTVHPTNLKILTAMKEAGTLGSSFEICPILPYAAGYVRTANEKGVMGLIKDTMSKLPMSKPNIILKGGLSAVSLDPVGMLNAYVDMELTGIMSLRCGNLMAVLMHEVLTDLGISFQAKGLFDSFMSHIRKEYDAMPGFVTRNLVRFVRFFEGSGLSLKDTVIMTPLNSIGFQMTPSKESCESCLSQISDSHVIAMSIMAGGYLGLDAAIEYLRRLQNLSGIVAGVSSREHAIETFTKLKMLLSEQENSSLSQRSKKVS